MVPLSFEHPPGQLFHLAAAIFDLGAELPRRLGGVVGDARRHHGDQQPVRLQEGAGVGDVREIVGEGRVHDDPVVDRRGIEA
jgi:hypothetical protein